MILFNSLSSITRNGAYFNSRMALPFIFPVSQVLIRRVADIPAAQRDAQKEAISSIACALVGQRGLFWAHLAGEGEATCAFTWAFDSSMPTVAKAVLAKIPAGSPSEALLVDHVTAWLACGIRPAMLGRESLKEGFGQLGFLRKAGRAALLPRLAARLKFFVGAHVMLGMKKREAGVSKRGTPLSYERFVSPFSRELTSPPGFLAEPWQLFLLLKLALELEEGAASAPAPIFAAVAPASGHPPILHPCVVWPNSASDGRPLAGVSARNIPLAGFEAAVRFVAKAAPASLNVLAPTTAGAAAAAALHLAAAEEGWLPLLSALLTLGGSAVSVDVRDGEGAAPLHYALRRGNLKAVELLAAYGADVCAVDPKSPTALAGVQLACLEVVNRLKKQKLEEEMENEKRRKQRDEEEMEKEKRRKQLDEEERARERWRKQLDEEEREKEKRRSQLVKERAAEEENEKEMRRAAPPTPAMPGTRGAMGQRAGRQAMVPAALPPPTGRAYARTALADKFHNDAKAMLRAAADRQDFNLLDYAARKLGWTVPVSERRLPMKRAAPEELCDAMMTLMGSVSTSPDPDIPERLIHFLEYECDVPLLLTRLDVGVRSDGLPATSTCLPFVRHASSVRDKRAKDPAAVKVSPGGDNSATHFSAAFCWGRRRTPRCWGGAWPSSPPSPSTRRSFSSMCGPGTAAGFS